jgi:hypothetical protein
LRGNSLDATPSLQRPTSKEILDETPNFQRPTPKETGCAATSCLGGRSCFEEACYFPSGCFFTRVARIFTSSSLSSMTGSCASVRKPHFLSTRSRKRVFHLTKRDLSLRERIAVAGTVIGFLVIRSRGRSAFQDLVRKSLGHRSARVQKFHNPNDHAGKLKQTFTKIVRLARESPIVSHDLCTPHASFRRAQSSCEVGNWALGVDLLGSWELEVGN